MGMERPSAYLRHLFVAGLLVISLAGVFWFETDYLRPASAGSGSPPGEEGEQPWPAKQPYHDEVSDYVLPLSSKQHTFPVEDYATGAVLNLDGFEDVNELTGINLNDIDLYLYGATGDQLTYSADPGPDEHIALSLEELAAGEVGTYSLEVKYFRGAVVTYDLTIDVYYNGTG